MAKRPNELQRLSKDSERATRRLLDAFEEKLTHLERRVDKLNDAICEVIEEVNSLHAAVSTSDDRRRRAFRA